MGFESPQSNNEGGSETLTQITERLKDLNEQLARLKGFEGEQAGEGNPNRSEMRKVLDEEHRLSSAQSPIDATNLSREVEYRDWVSFHDENKQVVQQKKESLQRKIGQIEEEISELEAKRVSLGG